MPPSPVSLPRLPRSVACHGRCGSQLARARHHHACYTDEGGRGLLLVAALSQRWGARYLDDGKCIWSEQELPQRDAPGAIRGAFDAAQAGSATSDA